MNAWTVRGRRVAGVCGLVGVLVVDGGVASAEAAGSAVPFSLAGPVGIAAVVVGVGGIVVGLIRRRKAVVSEANRRIDIEPVSVPLPAPLPAPRQRAAVAATGD